MPTVNDPFAPHRPDADPAPEPEAPSAPEPAAPEPEKPPRRRARRPLKRKADSDKLTAAIAKMDGK